MPLQLFKPTTSPSWYSLWHLVMNGMDPTYTRWIFQGEEPSSSVQDEYREMPETYFIYRDAFLQDDDVVEHKIERRAGF